MRPGSRDVKLSILITGPELAALKNHTFSMPEAFGLDRRIDRYQGTRPIGLYRWDVECLMDVIRMALGDLEQKAKTRDDRALGRLLTRLEEEYRETYDLDDVDSPGRTSEEEAAVWRPNKGLHATATCEASSRKVARRHRGRA